MKRHFSLFFTVALVLAAAILVSILPAAAPDAQPEAAPLKAEEISFAPTLSINDIHLRDNTSLYEGHDPYSVVTMYLTVQKGNTSDGTDHTWDEINAHSAYYYDTLGVPRYQIAGLLQVGNENGPLPGLLGYGRATPNAHVQIRGQTSSKNAQKSYKIELYDNSGQWNGQKTISLNKHQTDGMRFRNKLAFDLMSNIPQIMSLRTQFVHLYVRDMTGDDPDHFADYGLFTQVEQLNKTALRSHGLDRNGQLYKVEACEFYAYDALKLVTDPDYNQKAFEDFLEIKGDQDHTKLLEMIRMVNDYSLTNDEVLDACFDRENLAYWMAFMILMGNADTQNRNVFLYSPLNSSTWYFLPWDNDGILVQGELYIRGKSDAGTWEKGISNYWGNMIFRRALSSSRFRQELDDAIHDLRKNYLAEDTVSQLAERYAQTVLPYVHQMPDSLHQRLTQEQYHAVVQDLPKEITRNYEEYRRSLNSPMPFYVDLPIQRGNMLELRWESAFDMMGSEVSYQVTLARDYFFEDVLFQTQAPIRLNSITCDITLEPGQYFIRVGASNAAGHTQNSFDYYAAADHTKIYGAYSFFVKEDGTFEPYITTEGD